LASMGSTGSLRRMTARAPRRYVWHVAVYKAGVSLLYLPAISLYCRSLLKYREYGQSRLVLPWTLDKLRRSVSVNIQCRRETVRVDSLNQELGAQFSGQDTEFLGKTNQKGQTGQYGNYWLRRTFCQQYRGILISHTPNRLFRSDRSGTVYYQSRRKRWPIVQQPSSSPRQT
jgi:hypothetical protein